MRKCSVIIGLIAFSLVGCEKASEPVKTAERQVERKDQQGGSAP
jgi:hypothetical protein